MKTAREIVVNALFPPDVREWLDVAAVLDREAFQPRVAALEECSAVDA